MDEKAVLKFVAEMPGACYDYPFEEDFETAVFRHKDTKKWFGILLAAPGTYCGCEGRANVRVINVKTPPDLSVILRENYTGILPAYHMNKTHWISIVLQSDVEEDEIRKLLTLSFDLTKNRRKHEGL